MSSGECTYSPDSHINVPINAQIHQLVIQCCAKNLQNTSEIKIYLRYLNSLDVITGMVSTFSQPFQIRKTSQVTRCVLDKINFLTTHVNNPQKLFSLVLLLKRFATRHIHAFVKINFEKPTKHAVALNIKTKRLCVYERHLGTHLF